MNATWAQPRAAPLERAREFFYARPVQSVPVRRSCLLALALMLCAAHAQAARPPLRVRLEAGSCPDAARLEQQLAPLLPADAELQAAHSGRSGEGEGARVRVIDAGDQYSVQVDGVRRELRDPARDCLERARVAAVFIALNLAPPAAPDPVEAAPSVEAARPDRAGPRVGVFAFGAAAYAGELDAVTPGAGAGLWLRLTNFDLGLELGVQADARVALEPADGLRGRVELTRIPLSLRASYLWPFGRMRWGPVLGIVFDVLRLRGADLDRPQNELRLNPGALAGLELQLSLSDAISLVFGARVSAFPRAYQLAVEPLGGLGRTPRLWLSTALGLSVALDGQIRAGD